MTMGRSRYTFGEPTSPHFLTCTINNWTPVFTRPETVEIVLDSLRFLQRDSNLQLYGYVILENHMHLVAASEDLRSDIARFKSYTARCLVDFFEERGVRRILKQFAFHKRKHKTDATHQVWAEGAHPQVILSPDMLRQKLDYNYRNPVERGYVDQEICWRYSSARNYAGRAGLIEVFMDWYG